MVMFNTTDGHGFSTTDGEHAHQINSFDYMTSLIKLNQMKLITTDVHAWQCLMDKKVCFWSVLNNSWLTRVKTVSNY